MKRTIQIHLLKKQLQAEITRLEQATTFNLAQEQHKLTIYQQISSNYLTLC